MTITTADIKLLESERMTDTTDGGGRRTSRVIPDGTSGNIFPKVSRLDAVSGRVNLRKIFCAVDTANVDVYAGAHAIITDPPDNPKIGVLLMSTDDDFDQRAGARDRIESYVVSGPESRMRLYGRQPVGAKAFLAYQRTTETLPDIGDVYALAQEDTNGNILHTQYVRIDNVTAEPRTYEDDNGTYDYNVLTVAITSSLQFEFFGPDTPPRNSSIVRLGKIRLTSVADAARYYGVQPLDEAAAAGDLTIKLPSIYAPLVPTTQRESAISLAQVFASTSRIPTGVSFSQSTTQVNSTYQFPGPVQPNSVRFANGNAGYPVFDDGAGNLLYTGLPGLAGTINYDTGLVSNIVFPGASGGIAATASHAVPVTVPAFTNATPITLANRGSVFSEVLDPVPSPGTAVVDFRAQSRWYRLRDETGNGTLSGVSSADGTGTIDYVTGALVVTLGALPDVESSVIFSWGSSGSFQQRTTHASPRVRMDIQLTTFPLVASSCQVSMIYGTTPATVTLDANGSGSNSNFTCLLNRVTGLLSITFQGAMPDRGSSVTVTYNNVSAGGGAPPLATTITRLMAGSILLDQSIQPRSLSFLMRFSTVVGDLTFETANKVTDDGSGNLIFPRSSAWVANMVNNGVSFSNVSTQVDVTIGAINYSTGEITITNAPTLSGNVSRYNRVTGYTSIPISSGSMTRLDSVSTVFNVTATGGTTQATPIVETFTRTQAPFVIDLTTDIAEAILPGSVVFRIAPNDTTTVNQYSDLSGAIYIDRAGEGGIVGAIDYSTGRATFSDIYANGAQGSVTVQSCLTGTANYVADTVDFRTSGAPVRIGSLFVQATASDGASLSATADVNGNLSGSGITGTIQQDVGVVSVAFPKPVVPGTIRYSTIVQSNVALDATLLGLDPVRLPLDGRVPIFRPGNVAVIHNTQSTALTNPVSAGASYTVGRTGLSDLWLVSAAGIRVDPTKYTVNLTTGTVTMATPLDLTGVPQPLQARHRIEDMLLLTDAQIDGTITTASPLTHAYPTSGTYVSSAQLFGDTYARVTNVHDLATWQGEWTDTPGTGSNAQYNDILFPLEVTNAGAITERWRINFTGPTSFQVIGENSGFVASGTTGADVGPVNPLTLEPYFVIRSGGWGSGWSVGNQLRFNTEGAAPPLWMIRTILPGAALTGDSIDLNFRGDVDA